METYKIFRWFSIVCVYMMYKKTKANYPLNRSLLGRRFTDYVHVIETNWMGVKHKKCWPWNAINFNLRKLYLCEVNKIVDLRRRNESKKAVNLKKRTTVFFCFLKKRFPYLFQLIYQLSFFFLQIKQSLVKEMNGAFWPTFLMLPFVSLVQLQNFLDTSMQLIYFRFNQKQTNKFSSGATCVK